MLGCKGFTCLYGIVNVYVFFTFFLVIAVLVRKLLKVLLEYQLRGPLDILLQGRLDQTQF